MFDIPQSFKQDDMFYVNKNDLLTTKGPYGHIYKLETSYSVILLYIAKGIRNKLFFPPKNRNRVLNTIGRAVENGVDWCACYFSFWFQWREKGEKQPKKDKKHNNFFSVG